MTRRSVATADRSPEAPGRGSQRSAPTEGGPSAATKVMSRHGNYVVEMATFERARLQLVGLLHRPRSRGERLPAVVLLGPYASVKEHAPAQYATRLADEGYATLAFDCAHYGESAGEPRQLDEPERKIADVMAVVDYLASRPEIDRERIGGLGIGDGAAELIRAAVADARIRVLAGVAGHYRDHVNDLARVSGEGPGEFGRSTLEAEDRLAARLERAQAARRRYETTGEVEYLPISDPTRPDVALPGRTSWLWHSGCGGRGLWENRYAVMGDVAYFGFESLSAASELRAPMLMVNGASGLGSARRHHESIPAPKELVVEASAGPFEYYDDPSTVDRATSHVTRWFQRYL